MKRLLLVIVHLLFFASLSEAQWTNISAGKIYYQSLQGQYGSCITYNSKSNILAVGFGGSVWKTPNHGTTWINSGDGNATIFDIDLFDNSDGLLSTSGGLYLTHNSGLSWQRILDRGVLSSHFVRSNNEIVAVGLEFCLFSTDFGANWNSIKPANANPHIDYDHVQTRRSGEIYVMSLDLDIKQAYVFLSTNNGNSWVETSHVDWDCFSITIDSCDTDFIATVNEEIYGPTDGITGIYLSRDKGTSWTFSNQINSVMYFCGSITMSPDGVLFTQTRTNDGVLRSTDHGTSWVSIGGPPGLSDSRTVVAISVDTIFAADSNGTIYMTTNSGGVPYSLTSPTLNILNDTLFANDTITICDSVNTASYFLFAKCALPLNIVSTSFQGTFSQDYSVLSLSHDSIIIGFHPSTPAGFMPSVLLLTLSDGTTRKIFLNGSAKPKTPLALSTSPLIESDTIGGDIHIGIKVDGLNTPESVNMNINFDNTKLRYLNTTAPDGTILDIPGSTTSNSSRIHIPVQYVKSDTVSAYSNFTLLLENSVISKVNFDALDLPSGNAPCIYSITKPDAQTTVIGPSGCGIGIISMYMRDSVIPKFFVSPNPTNGEVTISSNKSLSNSVIEVISVIGTVYLHKSMDDQEMKTTMLDLSDFVSGVYYISIRTNSTHIIMPITLQH